MSDIGFSDVEMHDTWETNGGGAFPNYTYINIVVCTALPEFLKRKTRHWRFKRARPMLKVIDRPTEVEMGDPQDLIIDM